MANISMHNRSAKEHNYNISNGEDGKGQGKPYYILNH